MISRKKEIFYQSLVIILVAIIFSALFFVGVFFTYRHKFTDKLYLNAPKQDVVKIITLDNKSIQALGQWPLPRGVYADLLEKISVGAPKTIALDIIFSESSNDAAADAKLITVVKNTPNLFLPVELVLKYVKTVNQYVSTEAHKPFGTLATSTRQGFTNIILDSDGIFRKLPVFIFGQTDDDWGFVPLSVAVIQQYLGHQVDWPKAVEESGVINPIFSKTPADTISLVDVLDKNFDSTIFKDKIVLVGATAPNLHDEYSTPISKNQFMPGVFIHANIIGTILQNSYLHPVASGWIVFVLFLLSSVVGLAVWYFRKILSAIWIALGLLIGYLIFASLAFDRGVIFDILYPLLVIFFSFLGSVAVKYFITEKNKLWIKNAFSYYVSPTVASAIMKDPGKLKLGGERNMITIMFSDIRNFTALSEKLSPEDLVKLLNNYFTGASDIVMAHNGLVDKYIGDAMMALWGVPLANQNHAIDACVSALILVENLHNFRENVSKEIDIGIGINSGEAIVGNIGSNKRFNYTAIGDAVNLSSRLEGLCKVYGVRLVISENTYELVKNDFVCRLLDFVAVKGKRQPVKVYELVSDNKISAPEWTVSFQKGLDFYFARDWTNAIVQFQAVLNFKSDDRPTQLFIERCNTFIASPPPTDWNKVYVLKSK